jgi:hypothetical protein
MVVTAADISSLLRTIEEDQSLVHAAYTPTMSASIALRTGLLAKDDWNCALFRARVK